MEIQRKVAGMTTAFEAGLGVLGILLCWWFEIPLRARLAVSWEVVGRSGVALIPMAVLLVVAMRSSWRPLAELWRQGAAMVGRTSVAPESGVGAAIDVSVLRLIDVASRRLVSGMRFLATLRTVL